MSASTCNARKQPRLLDYLVGNGEYAWWNSRTERLRGPEIDDQVKFGGCLHRQVSWLVALENAPGIDTRLTIRFRKTAAVADQTASERGLAKCVDCSYPV